MLWYVIDRDYLACMGEPRIMPFRSLTNNRRHFRQALLATVVITGSTLAVMIVGEIILRFMFANRLAIHNDEKSLSYQYDPELGWFPTPSLHIEYTASRPISITNNSKGFRDIDAEPDPSKPLMVFVGDSYVWGFDAEQHERFTELLRDHMPSWEIRNIGVSGYGSDQEYLLLQRYYKEHSPQVVVLIYSDLNDRDDNTANMGSGYYKPYFRVVDQQLRLEGVPVRKSLRLFHTEHPIMCQSYLVRAVVKAYYKLAMPKPQKFADPTHMIIAAMRRFVTDRQGVFLVGLTEDDRLLEAFLSHHGIPYVDLTTDLIYPDYGRHWTPEGQRYVADTMLRFLRNQPVLAAAQATSLTHKEPRTSSR